MAITDESSGFNVSMPVAPAYGGYGNQGGFVLCENLKRYDKIPLRFRLNRRGIFLFTKCNLR